MSYARRLNGDGGIGAGEREGDGEEAEANNYLLVKERLGDWLRWADNNWCRWHRDGGFWHFELYIELVLSFTNISGRLTNIESAYDVL